MQGLINEGAHSKEELISQALIRPISAGACQRRGSLKGGAPQPKPMAELSKNLVAQGPDSSP